MRIGINPIGVARMAVGRVLSVARIRHARAHARHGYTRTAALRSQGTGKFMEFGLADPVARRQIVAVPCDEQIVGFGVRHVAVFGSVARGQARPESDIDVLVDLDPELPISVFEYARLKLYIGNVRGFGAMTCDAANYTVKLNTGTVDPVLGTSYIQFAMQGLRHQQPAV